MLSSLMRQKLTLNYGKINAVKYIPLDISRLKTCSISDRQSKVSAEALATPHIKGYPFKSFVSGLPDILASSDLKAVVAAIVSAAKNSRPVILGMGAHPIKVGLSPLIIDLIRKDIITAVAANGACIVHDFEMAFIGRTSEDVASELKTGSFGMARETGRMVNTAVQEGVSEGHGIGRSMGAFIARSDFPHKDKSLFSEGFLKDIPMTVHVAVGCDIIHMHPEADGASIGEGSLRDFRLLSSVVADLQGGVYINLGSSVILPEVFLKALTVARNLGNKVEDFTTVNMDFIQHYRPRENVLRRPGGRSYSLTGHHEIMFPLLAAMITEAL